FFQAEDGIRDFHVTGVQTCALPICPAHAMGPHPARDPRAVDVDAFHPTHHLRPLSTKKAPASNPGSAQPCAPVPLHPQPVGASGSPGASTRGEIRTPLR